jgi:hypothetical protein
MTGAFRELSGTWATGLRRSASSATRRLSARGALAVALGIAGLLLAAGGAVTLWRGLASPTPTDVTCGEFARARPAAAWLRLRSCAVDYLGAGYRDADGRIVELFLPVRAAGASPGEPAVLVAATRDPAVLAIAESGIGGGRQPTQEQFLLMMLKIVTSLGLSREIGGVVRTGFVERLRTHRVLSGLTTPLAADVVVLDVNARPGLAVPVVQAALGLGLAVVGLTLWRRRSAPIAAVGVVEPPPEPDRLRGLLIVNLAADSGPDSIEHAPPLGVRQEIVEQVSMAIDGIVFDARGRGHVRRGGHAVIIDVGTADPVPCAIAGADGVEGAAAIRRLLAATGWRAYIPAEGQFLRSGGQTGVTPGSDP